MYSSFLFTRARRKERARGEEERSDGRVRTMFLLVSSSLAIRVRVGSISLRSTLTVSVLARPTDKSTMPSVQSVPVQEDSGRTLEMRRHQGG